MTDSGCPADLISNNNDSYEILEGCYATGSDTFQVLTGQPGYALYTDSASTSYASYSSFFGLAQTRYWWNLQQATMGSAGEPYIYYTYNCEPDPYLNSDPATHLCWYMDGASAGGRCGAATSYGTDYHKASYHRPNCGLACIWCGQLGQTCCPPSQTCADGTCTNGTCQ